MFEKIKELITGKRRRDIVTKYDKLVKAYPEIARTKIEVKSYDTVLDRTKSMINNLKQIKDPNKRKAMIRQFKENIPSLVKTTAVSLAVLFTSKKLIKYAKIEDDLRYQVNELQNKCDYKTAHIKELKDHIKDNTGMLEDIMEMSSIAIQKYSRVYEK